MNNFMPRDEILFWRMIDLYFDADDDGLIKEGLQYSGGMASIISPSFTVNFVCHSGGIIATIYVLYIDRWLRTQNFSKPESRELFKKHMQVRLSAVMLPLTIHDEKEDEEEEIEI